MVSDNIRLIGTSHIAKQSVKKIKETYEEFLPDVFAVELDPQRLRSLLANEKPDYSLKMIRHTGVIGYFFLLVASYAQRKLGNIVNMQPGSDMKKAIELAAINKKKVLLVDQHINITIRKLNKALGFKFVGRLIKDFFSSLFPKRRRELQKKLHGFDLNKVPSDKMIMILLEEFKDKYPELYKVLLEDRNKVIASNIKKFSENNPDKKLLVVLGAAHLQGVKELLK